MKVSNYYVKSLETIPLTREHIKLLKKADNINFDHKITYILNNGKFGSSIDNTITLRNIVNIDFFLNITLYHNNVQNAIDMLKTGDFINITYSKNNSDLCKRIGYTNINTFIEIYRPIKNSNTYNKIIIMLDSIFVNLNDKEFLNEIYPIKDIDFTL